MWPCPVGECWSLNPQVTKLPNGLTVASSDLSLPATTVGVYVDTGSAYETVSGTSYVLQHMAFKVKPNRLSGPLSRAPRG